MVKTKKEFKLFNIMQYKQEEEYLSSMERKGWRFTKVIFPGIYFFEKCEPQNVTYRLDYNREGIANKPEYVQMFSDCGWEYLFDFLGYSYFRRPSENAEDNEEIFCDDESKFDMMKRVYKGRIISLIVIFFAIILPQYMMNVVGYGGGSIVQDILAIVFLGVGVLYLCLFGIFTVQFHQFERKLHPEDEQVKWKYTGIYCVIIVFALLFGGAIVFKFSSDYNISDRENGFVVESDRLNKTVIREYELKKGDTVKVSHKGDIGNWYVRIGKNEDEPIFYGNTYKEFENFSVEIHEDGTYEIVCRGKNAKGIIEFEIQ